MINSPDSGPKSPLLPPPPYTESVQTEPVQPYNIPAPSAPFVGHQQVIHNGAGYGPTPIVQQTNTVLPYYDPRSVHAVREASSRAMWRFWIAMAWAYGLIALVIWGGVLDSMSDE